MREIRIGAVSWDCSLPPDTYFGYFQTRSLSPKKFRTITPYYADVLGEEKITYHRRTQEEYDRELTYAIEAGIDYFAHVWYGEEGSRAQSHARTESCSHRVYELAWARKMHCSSCLRDKIHLCAIAGVHPFSDGDLKELVMTMQEPFYEKMEGRPLLYVFNGRRMDFITRVRSMCSELGFVQPYIVPMYNDAIDPNQDWSEIEALSAYACEGPGFRYYRELSDAVIAGNESRRQAGLAVIPLYSVGWDPSPRVERPCPWYGYANTDYIQFATAEELLQGAQDLVGWIRSKASDCFAGHIMTFAWNEFEEGGMICPMLDEACRIDTSRLEAFRRVSSYFREALREK